MTDLPKIITKKKKRRGRGYGSGRGGHTSGRGMKGQKSRSKIHILFEGVKVKKSFIKRLPLKRGKNKFKARAKPLVVKLGYLDVLPAGSKVNIDTLVKSGVVNKRSADKYGIKILGNGKVVKKYTVEAPISKSAAKKIVKAGGKIMDGRDTASLKKEKPKVNRKQAKLKK